jgi:hypothetical protein
VTTITESKPAQPSPEQVERAVALAAKLLAAHSDRSDRKPVTAGAIGRALVVTPPGSDHGKLLAAALRPAKWKDRPGEQCVVLQLPAGVRPRQPPRSAPAWTSSRPTAGISTGCVPRSSRSSLLTGRAPPRMSRRLSRPPGQGRHGGSFAMRWAAGRGTSLCAST